MNQRSKVDEILWDVLFSIFFLILLFLGYGILRAKGFTSLDQLTSFDLTLLVLGTWRLIRLFVYDKISRPFREFLTNENVVSGPRKTAGELLSCPWCASLWFASLSLFLYLLHPVFEILYLLLSISVVASVLQITANLIGWSAEKKKNDCTIKK